MQLSSSYWGKHDGPLKAFAREGGSTRSRSVCDIKFSEPEGAQLLIGWIEREEAYKAGMLLSQPGSY